MAGETTTDVPGYVGFRESRPYVAREWDLRDVCDGSGQAAVLGPVRGGDPPDRCPSCGEGRLDLIEAYGGWRCVGCLG